MENKSSNLELVLSDTSNSELLTSPDKEDLTSDLLKLGEKTLTLKKITDNKLLNSQMLDAEYKDTFCIQDSDMDFKFKKKRKKKGRNGDTFVRHDISHLKTDSSNLEQELPGTINEEVLAGPDKTDLTEVTLKQEQKRITLKETPINELLNSQVLDTKCEDTFNIQDLDLNFNLLKKKRKKKVANNDLFVRHDDVQMKTESYNLRSDTDTDYNYEDLLSRLYNIIGAKDSKSKSDNQKTIVMKPPQVIRIGTRRTSFVNFLDICKTLHRSPQHLHSYILAELATSASIDSNNQLIIKGRFEQKQIETILRRYIKEYVTCHACHSFDTMLQKDSRLCFLHCESCGSRWSVASIKSGFQAVTSKRAAIRAKVN